MFAIDQKGDSMIRRSGETQAAGSHGFQVFSAVLALDRTTSAHFLASYKHGESLLLVRILHHWVFGGSASILLVADDPFQASARKSMLESRFSSVMRADSAADALIFLQQPDAAERINLVILDLHMPGLRGPAFAAELRLRMPYGALLVLGREGESTEDYGGLSAHFLPWRASTEQMVAAAVRILSSRYSRVA